MSSLSGWYITPLIARERSEEGSYLASKSESFPDALGAWRTLSWVIVSTCQEPSFGKLFKERTVCPNVTSKPGLIFLQIMNKYVISSRKIWLLAFVLTPQLPPLTQQTFTQLFWSCPFGHFPLFNNSVLSLVIPFLPTFSNRIMCVIFSHIIIIWKYFHLMQL